MLCVYNKTVNGARRWWRRRAPEEDFHWPRVRCDGAVDGPGSDTRQANALRAVNYAQGVIMFPSFIQRAHTYTDVLYIYTLGEERSLRRRPRSLLFTLSLFLSLRLQLDFEFLSVFILLFVLLYSLLYYFLIIYLLFFVFFLIRYMYIPHPYHARRLGR